MNGSSHLDHDSLNRILEIQDEIDVEPMDCLSRQQWNHLDGCTECQQRLLDNAAGEFLRNELSGVLRESHSDTLGIAGDGNLLRSNRLHRSGQPWESLQQTLRNWLEPASHPELLGTLDRYEVESIVGWGGMGVVLKAFDSRLRRPVAIKLLLPRWADHGSARDRFLREARSAASVLHPSVIAIHGIDQRQEIPYLVMPLIGGPSLEELVQHQGPLPERQVVQIGWQVAAGLAAAHAQGVIHRDVKPANILLDNAVNRAIITDFGLARCQDEPAMTQTGWMAGTPAYMSPEQGRGHELDGRSDLFSLGAVLFFLCTGRPPFPGRSPMAILHQITHTRAADVRTRNEEISSTLAAVIARLLEPEPEARFASAAELSQFLERLLQHLQAPTRHQRPRLRRPISVNRWVAGLMVGGLLTASVVVATSYRWGLPTPSDLQQSNPKISHQVTRPSQPSPFDPTLSDQHQLVPIPQWERSLKSLDDEISELERQFLEESSLPSQ